MSFWQGLRRTFPDDYLVGKRGADVIGTMTFLVSFGDKLDILPEFSMANTDARTDEVSSSLFPFDVPFFR